MYYRGKISEHVKYTLPLLILQRWLSEVHGPELKYWTLCLPPCDCLAGRQSSLTSADWDTWPAPEVYLPHFLGYPLGPRVAEVHMPVPTPILLSEGIHRKIQKAASEKQFPLLQMDDAFSQHRVQGDRKRWITQNTLSIFSFVEYLLETTHTRVRRKGRNYI